MSERQFYEAVRDTARATLAAAVQRHGKLKGSDADRARLAAELTAEFGFPVEVVESEPMKAKRARWTA